MASISLCMIVKNEQDVICRCLDCICGIVDEIIIVDTGSTDKTKILSERYTNKLYDFKWIDDFSAARNFSFSKATCDYIMWLDADDVIDIDNQISLKRLKDTIKPDIDMVMMNYHVDFDENQNPTFTYERERLFKRTMDYQWIGEIHEVIPLKGNILHSDIAVRHQKIHPNEPRRNLRIFEKMLTDGKLFEPRQQYYYARELYYNGEYEFAIAQLKSFIDLKLGWVEDLINACKILADCYYATDRNDLALLSLFQSFSFDAPRAEICCDIGKHFMETKNYQIAIFWYKQAVRSPMQKNGGFILPDCYGYIPYLQLCVCYDKLGDIENAEKYNEMAGSIKPNSSSYLYNKNYFSQIK